MINVDMNIVEFTSDGVKVYDSWSAGFSAPREDITFGGRNDIKNIKYSQENGQGVVTFERAFNTGDQYDKALTPNSFMSVSFAWGKGKMGYHGSKQRIAQMIIPKSGDPSNLPPEPIGQFDFWDFHGITMTILWTGFSFVGYIFARFLRHLKSWIYIHWMGSGLTAVVSVGVLASSIKLSKNLENNFSKNVIF
jgi:hypothetical protein